MRTYGMAGHLIRRLHQISTQLFTKHMQEAGLDLTPVQFAAMDAIVTHPGIDQAGVAARIASDRATIGGVIDRLEQKGYVLRNVCSQDRRAREVQPTEKGVRALDEISTIVNALQEDILAGLDQTERAKFLELVTKAVGNFSDLMLPGETR